MTASILKTPAASATKTKKRPAPRQAERQAGEAAVPAAGKGHIRTLLVASCGWPTDADLPPPRRAAKR